MIRKVGLVLAVLLSAFGILSISILRTAAVRYEFNGKKMIQPINPEGLVMGTNSMEIDYFLAYPGKVLPDSSFWPIKALRDKVWFFLTTDGGKKADLLLLFADKRLSSSQILFERDKAEIGFSVLSKGEKYLEEAIRMEETNRKKGMNTTDFLQRICKASLKHYQVLKEIIEIAPEDAKPGVTGLTSYPKRVYEGARNTLLDKGLIPCENPFNWD